MDEIQKQQILKNIQENISHSKSLFEEVIRILPIIKSNKVNFIELIMTYNPNSQYSQWEAVTSAFILSEEIINDALSLLIQFNEDFETDIEKDLVSDQYITLLKKELGNNNQFFNNLNQIQRSFNTNIDSFLDETIIASELQQFYSVIIHLFTKVPNLAASVTTKISQLGTFKYFKDISTNIVIIGANGSGKSSFSRSTKNILGSNVAIISAQKVFVYNDSTSLPLGSSSLNAVYNFQSNEKLCRDSNITHLFNSDLPNLINSLIVEYSECASDYYNDSETSNNVVRRRSKLNTVFDIWKLIIQHRELNFDSKTSSITVKSEEGSHYKFNNLSDGEKAVFYYISHVILAKESSYIIIDEPENHLHLSIISKLWDYLEKERQDCRFIYLTHNLDFATSRVNAKKIWNKKFTPPASWDVQVLPDESDLPELLLMELLGSRKKIIFCEGTKSSLDYKLYNILFDKFTIMPVEGHLNVINYTKSFNKSKYIHGNKAFGIIDGDFHSSKEIESWKQEDIFTIKVQEVENLLCDKILLKAAAIQFLAPEDSIITSEKKLFEKIKKEIQSQATLYATQKANNLFKQKMIKNQKNAESLIKEIEELPKIMDVKSWIEERETLLNSIVENKDYESGLKYYNNKGLTGIVPINIEKDYKNKILNLLNKSPEVLQQFKSKYFSELDERLQK